MQSMSPYFLIKVPKAEEQERREKIGEIYIHPTFVWMTRNTQNGIIVSISPEAYKNFPEAKVGQILLTHHFVQGSMLESERTKRFLVHEDDTYFYYNVTATEYNGQNNQSFAIWTGEKIITHKDYIFLEKDMPFPVEGEVYDMDELQEKLAGIKQQIMSLTRNGRLTPQIIEAIQSKEAEQFRLSQNMHKKEYLRYKVAYSNPTHSIDSGSIVYALNIAANTEISFNGVDYRVVEKRYIAAY